MLSPFTVSTSSDRGYLTNSSATATRIGTEIKDITQSIFVMNSELLNDLAPLDLYYILSYAPGAGEAFTAALVVGLLRRDPLPTIAHTACAKATAVCAQPEAVPAGPKPPFTAPSL